jgi:platelet-activating factor acetylhydrolase
LAHQLISEIQRGDHSGIFEDKNNTSRFFQILDQLRGKFDFDNMVMMGHSFGGATSIQTMATTDLKFKAGIVLDPWMYSCSAPTPQIKIPLLNLQSHRFHWNENLEQMKAMTDHKGFHPKSQFGLILDTKHQDASDFSLFFSWFMSKAGQSGPLDPVTSHQVQDAVIADFLQTWIKMEVLPEKAAVDVEAYTIWGLEAWQELKNFVESKE